MLKSKLAAPQKLSELQSAATGSSESYAGRGLFISHYKAGHRAPLVASAFGTAQ